MQDNKLIAYARKNRNLFILDLAMSGKIMPTTSQKRPTHLVSYSKKVQVWHKRFRYASNARIICTSKLSIEMREFSANYDPAEIYSNFEASESEDLTIDNANLLSKQQIILKASKITDSGSDFDEICKLCIESKQTRVI